jgi:hypothetical protein
MKDRPIKTEAKIRRLSLIGVTLALFCILPMVAHAQEPSPRRLYMLCLIEDPSCRELFVGLVRDVVTNPIMDGRRWVCPFRPATLDENVIQGAYGQFMGMMRKGYLPFPKARDTMFIVLACHN